MGQLYGSSRIACNTPTWTVLQLMKLTTAGTRFRFMDKCFYLATGKNSQREDSQTLTEREREKVCVCVCVGVGGWGGGG